MKGFVDTFLYPPPPVIILRSAYMHGEKWHYVRADCGVYWRQARYIVTPVKEEAS